jgi:uncharacterized protein (DUF305 family)
MKFEITKKSGAGLAIVAITFFGLGLLVNSQRESDDFGHMGGGMHSNSSSDSKFSGNDLMFAQMMIPHHQQAVEMSDLALATSKNPKVLALARQIKDAQAPEISQMKGWLTSAGQSLMGNHGMSMDGMLSDDELAQLEKSSGATFDTLFLTGMIGHHEGALTMINMIENSENQEARTLAQNIKKSQSAEITLMKSYLADLK